MLHLENVGAAPMPILRPVQGRVGNMEGNPNAIADEGAVCRLSRYRYTQVNLKYKRQRNRKRIYALSSLQRAARS